MRQLLFDLGMPLPVEDPERYVALSKRLAGVPTTTARAPLRGE